MNYLKLTNTDQDNFKKKCVRHTGYFATRGRNAHHPEHGITSSLGSERFAIKNGPFIVDLNIKTGGSFRSYVHVYQRVVETL